MFFKAENYRHPAFMAAVRELAPQAPGVAAWGLMTGVAMVNSGLSVFESIAMTLLVYAGSSQLAALPLLGGGCTGLGHFGHGLLCQLALHGVQFAFAQIPHAFAAP
jgi:predicted branched-subunit amino acid permease